MEESWNIERYARLVISEELAEDDQTRAVLDSSKGKWQYYDSSNEKLILVLKNSAHLLICHGTTILESHALFGAQGQFRGVCKGDSMLFLYKINDATRQFRVKFDKSCGHCGADVCNVCATVLAKYFPVKLALADKTLDCKLSDSVSIATGISELHGEVTMKRIAEVMMKKDPSHLPKAYQHSNIATENVSTMLCLCLSDPSFPGYVEQVEKELENIRKDK